MATWAQLKEQARQMEQEGVAPPATSNTMQQPQPQQSGGGNPLTGTGLEALLLGGAKGLTMGFGDELRAAVRSPFTDKTYEQELESGRAWMDRAQKEHGGYYMGGELAGALAPALLTGGASAATSLPRAAMQSAAVGGAGAAAAGYGEGEGGVENRLRSAGEQGAVGTLLGGAFGAGSRVIQKGVAKTIEHMKRPTTESLEKIKNDAYKAVGDSGIVMEPQNMIDMVADMKQRVSANEFFDPRVYDTDKQVMDMINTIERKTTVPRSRSRALSKKTRGSGQAVPPEKTFTVAQLDKLRRSAWEKYDATDNNGMLDVINAIDDAIDRSGGGELMDAAREANKTFKKSQFLENTAKKVERQTGSTYAGGNINNKYRQAFEKILDNPKLARNFSPEEQQVMDALVNQDNMANALRLVGRMSPESGGLMQVLQAGLYTLDPKLLALPVAGFISKRISDRATKNMVEELRSGIVNFKPAKPVTQPSLASRAAVQGAATVLPSPFDLGKTQEQPPAQPSLMEELMRQRLQQ